MNIGILYPRSTAHPSMTLDFLDGLKTFLQIQNVPEPVNFFSESVGFGGAEKEVYEKAEKLLVIDNVDVLVAYIDERVLQILKPLLFSTGKLMVVVNPGANYPLNWLPQSNIIYLSLQHAFLCWLSGKKAAGTTEKNGLLATSFYDCGYLHTASIVHRFVKGGGKIAFNYINRQTNRDFHIRELTEFLSTNSDIHNLLCVYDSIPASMFYAQLNSFAGAEDLSLFVSPMMLEEKALENLDGGFHFSVDGYLPWMYELGHDANKYFVLRFETTTNRRPTIFSLLGWECGQVLEKTLGIAPNDFSYGETAVKKILEAKIESPRGSMRLDAKSHYFLSPMIECSIKKNEGKKETIPIDFPEAEWENFIQQQTTGPTSGWTNTYLCY